MKVVTFVLLPITGCHGAESLLTKANISTACVMKKLEFKAWKPTALKEGAEKIEIRLETYVRAQILCDKVCPAE